MWTVVILTYGLVNFDRFFGILEIKYPYNLAELHKLKNSF